MEVILIFCSIYDKKPPVSQSYPGRGYKKIPSGERQRGEEGFIESVYYRFLFFISVITISVISITNRSPATLLVRWFRKKAAPYRGRIDGKSGTQDNKIRRHEEYTRKSEFLTGKTKGYIFGKIHDGEHQNMATVKNSAERRKHPRFIKRLTTNFFVDQNKFTGISSDLSEGGLFIRTFRGVPANTLISIELMLPNDKIASLKGIVRRTLRTSLTTKKNGMGIEIIEKDQPFIDFVNSVLGRPETPAERVDGYPYFRNVSCYTIGSAKKGKGYHGQERRKHKRLQTDHLSVMSEMPSASEVKVMNLSMSGILIKADRRLDIGKTYVLKIGYQEKKVFAKTRVAWSLLIAGTGDTQGNVTPLYVAGMQFHGGPDEKLEELVNAINLDARNDIGHRNASDMPDSCLSRDDVSLSSARDEGSAGVYEQDCRNVSGKQGTGYPAEFAEKISDICRRFSENNLGYHELLDMSNSATAEDIRKAYYKKIKEFHPDRYPCLDPELKEQLTSLSAYLNEAYNALITYQADGHHKTSHIPDKQRVVSNKSLAREEFEKGRVQFWDGNLSAAEILLQRSVALDNSTGKYCYYYAKTLLRLGKTLDAEKTIRKAIKLEPMKADYLVEAGHIYQAMNLSHRARENFEMALRLEPTHLKAREALSELKKNDDSGGFVFSLSGPIRAFRKTIIR